MGSRFRKNELLEPPVLIKITEIRGAVKNFVFRQQPGTCVPGTEDVAPRVLKAMLTPHTSHLTPHPHTSHLTPHTSHPHTSHVTLNLPTFSRIAESPVALLSMQPCKSADAVMSIDEESQ